MSFTMKMSPNHHFMLNGLPVEPVSRTYQYRKIMKPMLERKRRARINKCLDELKDLMTGTLQADGENVSKLEKADILELTVRHLHRLRESNALFLRRNETINMDKFWAGFQHCAAEVSQFLSKYDHNISSELIKYIANYIPNIAAQAAVAAAAANVNVTTTTLTPTSAPVTPTIASSASSAAAASTINIGTMSNQRLLHTNIQTNRFPLSLNKPKPVKYEIDAANQRINQKSYAQQQQQHHHQQNPYTQNSIKIDESSSDGDSTCDGDAAGVWRPW